jgi:hypothetical protein
MIPGGHRDATDADALGPRGPTGECSQSVSFALPVVGGDVAPVPVLLPRAHAFNFDH